MLGLIACVATWVAAPQGAWAQAPCPPGTEHALILRTPRSVPIGLQGGLVDVAENVNSVQNISSATLTMQELAAQRPFYSYVFTAGDLDQLNSYNDVKFVIQFSPGNGPAQVKLSYTQTASDTSDQECVDQLSSLVRPAPAVKPRVPTDSGGTPSSSRFQRKPWSIVYSGDGAALLAGRHGIRSHLKWTAWNTSQGRGWGDDWHNNCSPDCARGTYFGYPVNVHVYRPRIVDGYLLFTRLTVTYTGARPPYPAYRHRSLTYRLRYDSQFNVFFWT
jgi:hypothetical protein